MTTVKISDETLKALGATAGDVEEKIKALITEHTTAKASLETAKTSADAFEVKITALDERLKAVESRKLEISAADRQVVIDAAVKQAETAAAGKVSEAIAKVGVNGLKGGGGDDQAAKQDFKQIVAARVATGMKQPEAVQSAIKSNPTEYKEWLSKGGGQL